MLTYVKFCHSWSPVTALLVAEIRLKNIYESHSFSGHYSFTSHFSSRPFTLCLRNGDLLLCPSNIHSKIIQISCRISLPNNTKSSLSKIILNSFTSSLCFRSALHYAASFGDVCMVKILFTAPNVLVNERDQDGCTPFFKVRLDFFLFLLKS